MPFARLRRARQKPDPTPVMVEAEPIVLDAEIVEIVEAEVVVEVPPITPENVCTAATLGDYQRTLAGLAFLSGHPLEMVQRIFRSDSDTAMLVICEDAGLSYAQSCVMIQKIGYIRTLRPISRAVIEEMRRYLHN